MKCSWREYQAAAALVFLLERLHSIYNLLEAEQIAAYLSPRVPETGSHVGVPMSANFLDMTMLSVWE